MKTLNLLAESSVAGELHDQAGDFQFRSAPPYESGTEMTREQVESLGRKLQLMVSYLVWLRERIPKAGIPIADPLHQSVMKAEIALRDLAVKLHYMSCAGGVGKPTDSDCPSESRSRVFVTYAASARRNVRNAASAQILTRAVRRSRRAGVADIRRHAGWGDPAEVIIETAQQFHVDAIVAGRRGRGRLTGLILGSARVVPDLQSQRRA
jgi:hypothetical protein